jgi:cellulose synthase/poly-beta-1,6-N-acetylglucosamine synthase-like glycosyltransferase
MDEINIDIKQGGKSFNPNDKINNRNYVHVNNKSGLENSNMGNNNQSNLFDNSKIMYNKGNEKETIGVNYGKNVRVSTKIDEDPFDYIKNAKKAVVSQQVDKKVFLTGCEPPVRYIVETVNEKETRRILKVREIHNWCQKNCCQ